MNKRIERLRTFFRVTNAAFAFIDAIQLATSGRLVPNKMTKMHQLHKIALIEIEKENPDMSLIDELLAEMEKEAESIKPNFSKGAND